MLNMWQIVDAVQVTSEGEVQGFVATKWGDGGIPEVEAFFDTEEEAQAYVDSQEED